MHQGSTGVVSYPPGAMLGRRATDVTLALPGGFVCPLSLDSSLTSFSTKARRPEGVRGSEHRECQIP